MNFFKEQRELKDLSVDYVCETLKYSRRTIEDLENDKINFMEKPYNFYCAKSYSELLKIKIPEELILKFK